MKTNELCNFEKLATDGFVHIKDFFSNKDIASLVNYFEMLELKSPSKGVSDYEIERGFLLEKLSDKFEPVLFETQKLGIRANVIESGTFFSNRGGNVYPWHQDFRSYFTCQNHIDYLNFYIPMIKKNPTKSNLSIIPFTTLKKECPELYKKVKGNGATSYKYDPKLNKTYIKDYNIDKVIHVLDYDISDLSTTPNLEVGDLLIITGDMIHKSQDAETLRTAASIRAVDSEHQIDFNTMITGGKVKHGFMFNNQWTFNYVITLFRKFKTNRISIGHLLETYYDLDIKIYKSKLLYVLFLKYLKITSSLKKVFKIKSAPAIVDWNR